MHAAAAFASLLLVVSTPVFSLVSKSGPVVAASRVAWRQRPVLMEYIPDGMSKAEWAKVKAQRGAKPGKFDGTSGMKFRSRTFEDFLKKRKDEGIKYNMPMTFASQKLKAGLIKPEDVPYMQRPGGMPDDSDLKQKKGGTGAFKFPWQK